MADKIHTSTVPARADSYLTCQTSLPCQPDPHPIGATTIPEPSSHSNSVADSAASRTTRPTYDICASSTRRLRTYGIPLTAQADVEKVPQSGVRKGCRIVPCGVIISDRPSNPAGRSILSESLHIQRVTKAGDSYRGGRITEHKSPFEGCCRHLIPRVGPIAIW